MKRRDEVVVGVDVGSSAKGFHAVALVSGKFLTFKASKPRDIANWCRAEGARFVAVDAPCDWSVTGKSRKAERDLAADRIHCYATPNRARAEGKPFYDWVFNGRLLYQALQEDYSLFDGTRRLRRVCLETFPHAIVCALKGQVVRARPKAEVRRAVLRALGLNVDDLANIDYVDAALCAIAAGFFRRNVYDSHGDKSEGFIIVPRWHV